MSVASFLQTIWASMTPTAYKNAIDANFAVAKRSIDNFAPNQQAAPNMTVLLDAGHTYDGTTLTEVAAQSTATIATPATGYMRIDRIVINSAGVNSVITGTPVTSAPVAPAITGGAFPVCQVLLDATSAPVTAIVNSMITDERVLAVGYATNATNAHYAFAGKNVYISQDTNLQTWADSLPRCGMYDVYLTVAQGNLPADFWHLELQRYSGDAAGALYHVITAKGMNEAGLMYTNTCMSGTWSGWIQVVTSFAGTAPHATNVTGTVGSSVTGTTQATSDNSTLIATDAFVQAVANPGASLGTNGYQKFPSGLIVQWGFSAASVASSPGVTVNFPIAFPNAAFSVVGSVYWSTAANIVTVLGLSTTQATFNVANGGSGGLVSGPQVYWYAIGH